MIAIVNLGVGNFPNVRKALEGKVTNDPEEIRSAEKLVLPGVGNFGVAAQKLKPLKGLLVERLREGIPFLGICLGMQLLFSQSSESKGEGLGVFAGEVVKLYDQARPHIGWNQVFFRTGHSLMKGLTPGTYFYFVHSYRVKPTSDRIVVGKTDYETLEGLREFPSVIKEGNIFGVQFHPEKSGQKGLKVLQNFKEI